MEFLRHNRLRQEKKRNRAGWSHRAFFANHLESDGSSRELLEGQASRDAPLPETSCRMSGESVCGLPDFKSYILAILFLVIIVVAFRTVSFLSLFERISFFARTVSRGGIVTTRAAVGGIRFSGEKISVAAKRHGSEVYDRWASFLTGSPEKSFVLRQENEEGAVLPVEPDAGFFQADFQSAREETKQAVLRLEKGFLLSTEDSIAATRSMLASVQNSSDRFLLLLLGMVSEVGKLSERAGLAVEDFLAGAERGRKSAYRGVEGGVAFAHGWIKQSFDASILTISRTISSADGRIAGIRNRGAVLLASRWDKALSDAERLGRAPVSALTLAASSSPIEIASLNETDLDAAYLNIGSWQGFVWWNRFLLSPRLFVLGWEANEVILGGVRQKTALAFDSINRFTKSLSHDAVLAWTNFFRTIASLGGASRSLSDAEMREQLKKEILQELGGGTKMIVENTSPETMFSESGVVVMKPTGSSTIDARNIKKIQDSFSDRVIVKFDEAGQAGQIQPIFRDRVGEKYLFVITPIKR